MELLTDNKTWKDVNRDEARALIPLAFVSDLGIRSLLNTVASKTGVEAYAKSLQPQVHCKVSRIIIPLILITLFVQYFVLLRISKWAATQAWKPLPSPKKLLREDSQREIKCSDSNCLFCCCCFLITGGLYHMTRDLLIQNILLTSASCAVKQRIVNKNSSW